MATKKFIVPGRPKVYKYRLGTFKQWTEVGGAGGYQSGILLLEGAGGSRGVTGGSRGVTGGSRGGTGGSRGVTGGSRGVTGGSRGVTGGSGGEAGRSRGGPGIGGGGDQYGVRLPEGAGGSRGGGGGESKGGPVETRGGGARFVDEKYAQLVARVTSVMALADYLKSNNMIHEETYSEIRAERTNQEKMRKLYEALNSGGDNVKNAFYNALRKHEPYLLEDLGGGLNLT
ncbi:uncharacterized protein [Misgurnus anguillicaudatus]|uniref:uncharacterized protein isoform X2 n=1 Tax=Misgurnus anguillicaudatus TaxID=75329 RepID=UPI003CCF6D1C